MATNIGTKIQENIIDKYQKAEEEKEENDQFRDLQNIDFAEVWEQVFELVETYDLGDPEDWSLNESEKKRIG